MDWWEDFKEEFADAFIDTIDPGVLGYLAGLAVLFVVMISPFVLFGCLVNRGG